MECLSLQAGHDHWLNLQQHRGIFSVQFLRRATVLMKDFHEAAAQALECLLNRYHDRPLYLAFSGGVDSELVANVMYDNGTDFTPVILKIPPFNDIESRYAEDWCVRHRVQPLIVSLDIDEFATQFRKFLPALIKMDSLFQTPMMYLYDLIDSLGGYCIAAAGDINLDIESRKFYCYSLDFASDVLGNGHPTSFFMYTPELALSYINKFDESIPEQQNKLGFYGVTPRPKIDYLTSLHSHPIMHDLINKANHITGRRIGADEPCWYGKKEEIMARLLPPL